ncbi:hypothetical protein N7516_011204 [Penicillium verrucosum]|uniref:uncharacterized protein n=1 Tax=Penicillium verrucosum TaxID=60171 RepID=UPI0025451CEA|nr:uncharacterized protein N7516_011204 [Penicillium verrucosum]KAJ5920346.1 hypothetical protein N7516_011204 [Penicillium verrucosum]
MSAILAIIGFSVNSPPQRAAWKPGHLRTSHESTPSGRSWRRRDMADHNRHACQPMAIFVGGWVVEAYGGSSLQEA